MAAGIGGHALRRMRKMIAAIPHASPTSPGNLQKPYVHPPSLGTTKNTSLDGTTDDVTKTKMGISSTGLVAMPPRRRRRRLISASPSNSQPSPGY
nr:hypothetical protein Iba_chr02aCG21170 [Ipomoea batatas]GMD86135.1 hypothetical protein Iba_chr14bCG3170 [Ipomoea batatas]